MVKVAASIHFSILPFSNWNKLREISDTQTMEKGSHPDNVIMFTISKTMLVSNVTREEEHQF